MKKSIILLFAMLLAVAAYSQNRDDKSRARRREINPEMMAVSQTENLHKVLELDSVQYNMVMLMNYSDAMAMQENMKAREGERRMQPSEEERRARAEVMKQRRALRDEQMKKILTSEQYEKYLKYMQEVSKNGRHGGKRPRREAPHGARE